MKSSHLTPPIPGHLRVSIEVSTGSPGPLTVSARALSKLSPFDPTEPSAPASSRALGVPDGEVPHTPVAVVDEAVEGPAASAEDGHLEGVEGEVGAEGGWRRASPRCAGRRRR